MNSIWNTFSMDDTGNLKVFRKKVYYSGKKFEFEITDILRVYLAKKIPNYGLHFVSFLVSFGCVSITFLMIVYSIEYFLVFLIMILALYPVSLFGVKSNWIGVEYLEDTRVKRAFFSDGSHLGFKKGEDGSESLYEKLKDVVEENN